MKVLIIFSHPDNNIGISFAVLKSIKEELAQKGAEFEVLDLYKMNYDPILKISELYTAGNREVSAENLQIQQKIAAADRLAFIYPVWWGGMPAILKGFVDRVFTPGFAYKYRRDKFIKFLPDKLLPAKKVAAFVSFGSPKFVYTMLLHPVKIINKFVIFGLFCKKSKTFCIFGANSAEAAKRQAEISSLTKKGINWLLK